MGPDDPGRVVVVVGCTLLGLVIGSFLNVVIYRVPRGLSIVRPPSHCPTCGTQLTALDNIPLVSWAVLRGRCRHCGSPISVRYPLVELSTGVVFLAVGLALQTYQPLVPLLVVVAAVIPAAAIDLDGLAVPAPVVAAAWLGAASLALVAVVIDESGRTWWAFIGAAALALVIGLSELWAAHHRTALDAATERGRPGAGRWERVGIGSALGWSVAWLWPPSIALFAGWAALLGIVAVAVANRHVAGRPPLWATCAGGVCVLIAASAITTF